MSRIKIHLDRSIGTVAPEIFGHFAEHIGGVIYDGICLPSSGVVSVRFPLP